MEFAEDPTVDDNHNKKPQKKAAVDFEFCTQFGKCLKLGIRENLTDSAKVVELLRHHSYKMPEASCPAECKKDV